MKSGVGNNKLRMSLFFLLLLVSGVILPLNAVSSELTGKTFFLNNSNLPYCWIVTESCERNNERAFRFKGVFVSETQVEVTIFLADITWFELLGDGHHRCDLIDRVLVLSRVGSSNEWKGDSISFNFSNEGVIKNFLYTYSNDDSSGYNDLSCKLTIDSLNITVGLPFLQLLLGQ